MKKLLLLCVVTISLLCCKARKSDEIPTNKVDEIILGHKEMIHSALLNEDREYWIHVPHSDLDTMYTKTKYPVLYLLDGPAHFYSVTGMMKQLSSSNGNSTLPEMIVVAIANTNRSRDLTPTSVAMDFFSGDSIQYDSGGGAQFLDFIETELIPHIDTMYSTAPYRTFVGHSFGGLAVLNALIRKPALFDNYIAIDPSLWWENKAFLKTVASQLTSNSFNGKSLYVGVANTMSAEMNIKDVEKDSTKSTAHIRSILQFVKSMETNKENGLNFEWKYYPENSHGSVPLIATYDAFHFLFPWHELKGINQFFNPKSTATATDLIALINAHYENISRHYGYESLPPEALMNSLGYEFMTIEGASEKAHAVFDLNMQNFPTSSNVYDSMGDFQLAQKDSLQALELFQKALTIGENKFSQEKIDLLKDKLMVD
jgi:hypothetical protein